MAEFQKLFQKYRRLVIFDTETTGLHFSRDEIIEFAAVVMEVREERAQILWRYDQLIQLSPGCVVPPKIEELTGITTRDIFKEGISKQRLYEDLRKMIVDGTLLVAYNAHFDLSFLYYFLLRHGDPALLKGKDKLDLLTVYKDRREYPHKLKDAIEKYGLAGQVVNSHRAIDDVIATVEVMRYMEMERDDLECYVNLFGYNSKYGISGKPIRSVTYKPQSYYPKNPLYVEIPEEPWLSQPVTTPNACPGGR